MGFRYRSSKNVGPFRINFGKKGIGWSVGGKGFRYTKKSGGGVRTTTSIPGSGMSWVKDYSDNNKKKVIEEENNSSKISTGALIYIAFIIFVLIFFLF